MLLSIIIVNYNSSRDIQNCLKSAEKQLLENKEIEWILVDNDILDNGVTAIVETFPFIHYISMGYNAGFARANNAGIKMAKGENILLLNPDTLIKPDAIEKCLEKLTSSEGVACGVQLIHANGQPQFSGSKFVAGGINHLLDLPYWGACLKWFSSVINTAKPAILKASTVQEVDWVSGAFLMVKKWAIDKAGLLDEDFFLYAEEVEWCSRLRKLGKLYIFGDIEIVHLIGTSIQAATDAVDNSYTNLSDKKGLQLMVSNHLRIRKQYGNIWFFFQLLNFTWTILFANCISFLWHLAHGKSPLTELNYLNGFANNVISLWRLSPTIVLGKPYFYKCI